MTKSTTPPVVETSCLEIADSLRACGDPQKRHAGDVIEQLSLQLDAAVKALSEAMSRAEAAEKRESEWERQEQLRAEEVTRLMHRECVLVGQLEAAEATIASYSMHVMVPIDEHDKSTDYAGSFARDLVSTNTGRFQVEAGDGTMSDGDYSCIICDARSPTEPLEHKPDCVVAKAVAYLAGETRTEIVRPNGGMETALLEDIDRMREKIHVLGEALKHQRTALMIVRDRQGGRASDKDIDQGIKQIDAALSYIPPEPASGVLAVGNLDWGAMKEAHRLWWKDATHEQRYDSLTIFEAGAKWAQTIPSQGTIRDRIEALLLHDLEEACTPSECALLADRLAAALVNPQEPTR